MCKRLAHANPVNELLVEGLFLRLICLLYCIIHDYAFEHIKYTDIDYHVFTNGSKALVEGLSPYRDTEYRYSPIVAAIFLPNVILNKHIGKLILIGADVLGGFLIYKLNIYQGSNRQNSKLYLFYWLFNPVTVVISSRGSFEPILTLVILSSILLLVEDHLVAGGLLYGLAIHLKLYPVIYAVAIYGYLLQKKPYLRGHSRIIYWLQTLGPKSKHWKFFLSALLSLITSTYICYRVYGYEYLDQSFIYHLKRKDFQHNFSVYFYLFHLFPRNISDLNILAFATQLLAVLGLSLYQLGYDLNRRVKLRKLYFSLFSTTFAFVSLNKVCTSQYFNWYLVFLPLIMDSTKMEFKTIYALGSLWFMFQGNWLLNAYLYEYQKFDILDHVGMGSILFLGVNLFILFKVCQNFDPNPRTSSSSD